MSDSPSLPSDGESTGSAHPPVAPVPRAGGSVVLPKPAVPQETYAQVEQHVLQTFSSANQPETTSVSEPEMLGPEPGSSLIKQVITVLLVVLILVGVFAGLIWFLGKNISGSKSSASATSTTAPGTSTPTTTSDSTAAGATTPIVVASPLLSSQPSPTLRPQPSPSPTLEPSPVPSSSPTSSAVDLSVEAFQVEDAQNGTVLNPAYTYAGMVARVRATVKNNGTQNSKVFRSYWVINGKTVGANLTGKLNAQSTAVYDNINSLVSPNFFLQNGTNTVNYVLDPENVNLESNVSNNTRNMGISTQLTRQDLQAEGLTFYQQNTTNQVTSFGAGQALTLHVRVKNNGSDKLSGFEVRLSQNNSVVASSTYTGWINPGQTVDDALLFNFTSASGSNTFKADLNPNNDVPETNTANNTVSYTLSI